MQKSVFSGEVASPYKAGMRTEVNRVSELKGVSIRNEVCIFCGARKHHLLRFLDTLYK